LSEDISEAIQIACDTGEAPPLERMEEWVKRAAALRTRVDRLIAAVLADGVDAGRLRLWADGYDSPAQKELFLRLATALDREDQTELYEANERIAQERRGAALEEPEEADSDGP